MSTQKKAPVKSKARKKPKETPPLTSEELNQQEDLAKVLFDKDGSIEEAAAKLDVTEEQVIKWLLHPQARPIHLKVWKTHMDPLLKEFRVLTDPFLQDEPELFRRHHKGRVVTKQDLKEVDRCAARMKIMGKRIEELQMLGLAGTRNKLKTR